jgi:hypothetical protein
MPTNTYTALATVTLGGTDSEIVFASIPNTYKDLILIINGKASVPGADSAVMRFNSDTGSNYSNVRMVGTGSAATSYSDTAAFGYVGVITNSTNPFSIITQIMDYSATDKHKTFLSRSGQDNGWASAFAARWANTAAITSVSVLVPTGSTWTYQAGTTFSLYGVIA